MGPTFKALSEATLTRDNLNVNFVSMNKGNLNKVKLPSPEHSEKDNLN
jgi:hypothetical protein